jgi:hypothetical protein
MKSVATVDGGGNGMPTGNAASAKEMGRKAFVAIKLSLR